MSLPTEREKKVPSCWLWPNRVIRKKESAELRLQYNSLCNRYDVAFDLLVELEAVGRKRGTISKKLWLKLLREVSE